jgi:hypothetical protein
MVVRDDGALALYEPNKPFVEDEPFLVLRDCLKRYTPRIFNAMRGYAETAFSVLEASWAELGVQLASLRPEFGLNQDGDLRLAGVIDNSSWQLIRNGRDISLQRYGNFTEFCRAVDNYMIVAELSNQLRLVSRAVDDQ